MQWKRTIGWTFAGIIALLVIAVLAGVLFLRSHSFQNYARHKIEQQAADSTGARTEVGKFDFNLATLTAHLYQVNLHGKEGPDHAPLLHADKLTVTLKLRSVFHPSVGLNEILIDHPVVSVSTDAQGNNNLPQAPPSKSSSHTSVFDLAIGHLQLTGGEINYNDAKIPLEADLYGLGTDVTFEPFTKTYRGGLSYASGRIKYGQYPPFPHDLNARFSASPDRFILQPLVLRVGDSELSVRGDVADYSNPVANGNYELRLHAQDLSPVAPSAKPSGDLLLKGSAHYQASANEPLLQSVSAEGEIDSDLITAAAGTGSTIQIKQLHAGYQLAQGALNVKKMECQTLGGTITGDAVLQDLTTTPRSLVHAQVKGISLREAQRTIRASSLKDATVSGTLNGKAEALWRGSLDHLHARADLEVKSAASSISPVHDIPVNGAIHATYDGASNILALRDTALRIPSANLTATGQVSDRSNLQVRLASSDLHELVAFISSFRPAPSSVPAISGSALLNAEVQGSTRRPRISGNLNAQKLLVQGTEWTSAKFDLQADPSRVVIRNGLLTHPEKGQASFSATVGLRNWGYNPADPIQANLSAHDLQIEDLQKLANQHFPVSGALSAELALRGTQLNPVGSGTARLANARAYDEPIQSLTLKFDAASGVVNSTLNVAAPAGVVNATVSFTPRTKAYKAKLNAPGIVLQKLQTFHAKNASLTGTATASASGEGTLDDPRLTAELQLTKAELKGSPIGTAKADLKVLNHGADFDLDSQVADVPVKAHGHLALSGAYPLDAAIDTGVVTLERAMATAGFAAPPAFHGESELHATMKGSLKDMSRFEAHVSIPKLQANYQTVQIGIAQPVRADFANSVVTLQPAEIRGTGTSLRVRGQVPVRGNGAPDLNVQGSIDLHVLNLLVPDARTGGSLVVDIHGSGATKDASIQGRVQIKNVSFATADMPLGLEGFNGNLEIDNQHIQISEMKGEVGGGQVSVGGSIAYRPSPQFNIVLQGQSVRLRYPDGLSSLLDANLLFAGTQSASLVSGRVLISGLTFSPDFDLAKFADQFSNATTTPTQPGFADTIKLAVHVQSTENLSATSSQVSIGGTANLQVTGTAADPVITGRTNLSSGELFFRNVRYELQRGVIAFDNPHLTSPVMNVSVTTTVEQYNLTLAVRGPLDKLTVTYQSEPPLATADIINLIARGQTTQEASATGQSTDSMLASGAASELSNSVQKLAGLSSLQIDPLLGGNNQNPSARVAIQQRVSKNLFFTFSTDVSQPGSEIVQGEYQINKRWSASVTRDQLGGVSVDGRYHTRF